MAARLRGYCRANGCRHRQPLLPLGTYKVAAELPGFKKFEQSGITLSVGMTAVINATLSVGAVSETITVNAESPLVDTARIDIGHTMTDLEVHNLPLVARNPYNFALVQPGVTGIENVEFGVPRLAANGAAMRINYQIDGNTNTEKDRAGLRLLPMSEVMIQEVKVVTTGFAPEFGQTMGMVYNAVTPSGTNKFRGEASYLFRRKAFSAFPFFFGCGSTTPAANCPAIADNAVKPETRVDTGTAAVGGIVLVLGTIVTGSGPHSGDATRPARTSFDPRFVSWMHADTVMLFCGLVIATLVAVRITATTAEARRAWDVVLTETGSQAPPQHLSVTVREGNGMPNVQQEKLDLTVIVMNDRGYGVIKRIQEPFLLQRGHFPRRQRLDR